jgi:hypothetical protein
MKLEIGPFDEVGSDKFEVNSFQEYARAKSVIYFEIIVLLSPPYWTELQADPLIFFSIDV